jgi:ubiquinone/menaquinone biosynthesis C-methylase UbiE
MSSEVRSNPWSQIAAWIVGGVFIAGFFFDGIGAWTGPILSVWFVGTQRLRRGFLWVLAFAFVPGLLMDWRRIPWTDPKAISGYVGLLLLASVLGVLPFSFHRLTSARLPGLVSTLPLPVAVVTMHFLVRPMVHLGVDQGTSFATFLIFWLAAVVVWMWNLEFCAEKIAWGAGVFAAVFISAEGYLAFSRHGDVSPITTEAFGWACLGAVVLLCVWAAIDGEKRPQWAQRPETVALLRSPFTGAALHVMSGSGHEALVGSAGERFPIRNGIPNFLRPEDLTGDNGKYNHLYETIGGFYDDTQRVFCAFRGVDRDSYFLNYMRLLEVKPGDSVLETSVGTGLNFKYLPPGVKLSGLDLSPEMLKRCQVNLTRWGMQADLYLGNAESLPFADSSFDVVFHVGGISFFNDKEKAIREMIRVAKPGSLLLIEDETEDYAKSTYERIPITSSYYKNRKEEIVVPIDLVPAEMEDIRLEMLKGGKFFAITFRKPRAGAMQPSADGGFVFDLQFSESAPALQG